MSVNLTRLSGKLYDKGRFPLSKITCNKNDDLFNSGEAGYIKDSYSKGTFTIENPIGNINITAFNGFASGSYINNGEGAEKVISKIINIFIAFAGSLAVLAIIYAGLLYTYSNGEEEVLTKAKKIWFSAILGLLLTLLSYMIVSIIQGILYSF